MRGKIPTSGVFTLSPLGVTQFEDGCQILLWALIVNKTENGRQNPPASFLPLSPPCSIYISEGGVASHLAWIMHEGPWQLLYHWPIITPGTPLWPHPRDRWDRKTKAEKKTSATKSLSGLQRGISEDIKGTWGGELGNYSTMHPRVHMCDAGGLSRAVLEPSFCWKNDVMKRHGLTTAGAALCFSTRENATKSGV